MRTGFITLCLCFFFFILPIQCYFISNDLGVGVQGAVYRFQVTPQGNSLITLPKELNYVVDGTYEGRTSFSIAFWGLGTIILMAITILSLVYLNRLALAHIKIIKIGLLAAAVSYLVSVVFQYGVFFTGMAGISLPIGTLILIITAVGLHMGQDIFFSRGF
jgi:hypothetical protein